MKAERSDPTTSTPFAARMSVEQVEEGLALAPKFDADGLIPCITTDANTGEVLMLGYMNGEALQRTIATGEGSLALYQFVGAIERRNTRQDAASHARGPLVTLHEPIASR